MKFCRKCGAQMPDDAVFCEACGTQVVSPTSETQQESFGQTGAVPPVQEAQPQQTYQQPQQEAQPQQTYQQPAQQASKPAAKKSSKTPIIIACSCVIVLLIVFLVLLLTGVIGGKSDKKKPAQQQKPKTEQASQPKDNSDANDQPEQYEVDPDEYDMSEEELRQQDEDEMTQKIARTWMGNYTNSSGDTTFNIFKAGSDCFYFTINGTNEEYTAFIEGDTDKAYCDELERAFQKETNSFNLFYREGSDDVYIDTFNAE